MPPPSTSPDPARDPAGPRIWSRTVRPLLSAIFFLASAWLLWRQLRHLSWAAFVGALAATSPGAVLFSAALAIGSYACLAGTERLALAALGHRFKYRDAARVAVPAYALTNTAGFSPATGTLFRVQMYRRYGLDAGASAMVALVAGAAVTVSGVVSAGLMLLLAPVGLGQALQQPAIRMFALGVVLILPAALWFVAFTPRSPAWLGGGRTSLPDRRTRAFGLAAGLGDWLFSSAALFVLMPNAGLTVFPAFFCAYIAGSLVSAATGVPGGIGVFEAIVLTLTALMTQAHETAAALLLYRCIYSLGPLAIWGLLSLTHPWIRTRGERAARKTTARPACTPQPRPRPSSDGRF